MPIDMLDFLFRVAQHRPELAKRNVAARFISQNGFGRADAYGVVIGEKKRKRAETVPIAEITVQKEWDKAPATLGMFFVLRQSLPKLDALKCADDRFIPNLCAIAHDDDGILRAIAQYHWLLDLLNEKCPQIGRWARWPVIKNFRVREPIPVEPLTADQLAKL